MKKQISIKWLAVLMAAGLLTSVAIPASNAHAAMVNLAAWETTGKTGTEAFVAGSGSAHVSAVDLTRGDGLTASSAGNNFGSTGWSGSDAGDYYEFGLEIETGHKATLGTLSISTRSSATGPGTIGFYSSQDGYASPFYTVNQGPGGSYVNSMIDLSGLGAVSGSWLIRLFEIGDTQADGVGATASTGTFRAGDYYDGATFQDIVITGEATPTSAVPVPAAAWLLGSGLVSLMGLKRRQSQS